MSDLKTLVAQEVAKQLAAIAADQTTKKVLEFLKNRNSADAYVVETGGDSLNWFRKYSDEWMEQGGVVENTAAVQTISLNKPFTSTNYFATVITDSNLAFNASMNGILNKTTSTFDARSVTANNNNPGSDRKMWFACGY